MTIGSLFPSRASMLLTLATLLSVATLFVSPANAQDHPDRIAKPDVPQGKVSSGQFSESQIFPGTRRDYSVYVPAQYREDQPANLPLDDTANSVGSQFKFHSGLL